MPLAESKYLLSIAEFDDLVLLQAIYDVLCLDVVHEEFISLHQHCFILGGNTCIRWMILKRLTWVPEQTVSLQSPSNFIYNTFLFCFGFSFRLPLGVSGA